MLDVRADVDFGGCVDGDREGGLRRVSPERPRSRDGPFEVIGYRRGKRGAREGVLFLGPQGALGGGSAMIESAIAAPKRRLSNNDSVCLTVPTTEVVAVAGSFAIARDELRAGYRKAVGEVTHANSAYGLRSELKAGIISEILVSAALQARGSLPYGARCQQRV